LVIRAAHTAVFLTIYRREYKESKEELEKEIAEIEFNNDEYQIQKNRGKKIY
jgi:hypothetical protein